MILIIDNYDSFVYTLAGYVERLNVDAIVKRNDKIALEEIEDINPAAIILSPGPCTPKEAGICIDLIKKFGSHIPILGVCLGHQAIGEAYGGTTTRARKPIHGKTSDIEHDGSALFHDIPHTITAGRYHSLVTDLTGCDALKITALSTQNEIMAIQHTHYPVFGVQFHPESTLTPYGLGIIKNFLDIARDWHTQRKTA